MYKQYLLKQSMKMIKEKLVKALGVLLIKIKRHKYKYYVYLHVFILL
jgi:hypothetical protein